MSNRRICVVTGSRAEYGLLQKLMGLIKADTTLELQLMATGMHLSPEFGLTYKAIESDGYAIDAKVEMLLSGDSGSAIAKSIGLGVIGFADAFARLQPDLVLVLGDRFEILAVVQAALVARIPVAHIAGGDTTEGAYDEAIRHSITKMSHLHFVTNEAAARRVRQLGENPDHIYNVGNPGLDQIGELKLLSRAELAESLNFEFKPRNLLVTFHPVTLDAQPAEQQFQILLNALESLGPEVGLIFTKPNADNEGRTLIRMIDEFVARHPNAGGFTSLGQLRYLSTVAQVDAVVGNSSSGLCEVPSLKKPAVNIGERQRGRIQSDSVINCGVDSVAIAEAIRQAFELDCSATVNPYGSGNSSRRILEILKQLTDPKSLLKKRFFDLN